MRRLLHLGNVVVDLVLNVPDLPQRGADVLAAASRVSPGGGFNVLAAAARQGLAAPHAGPHRRGEAPFLPAPGAEAPLTAVDLAAIRPAPGDVVYLSGYSFLHPASRAA